VQPSFQLTRNVTLLGTEFFNLYLIKGETYAIVEGGVSGITYSFLQQLAQENISPEAISYLVISHSHFDHMMVFVALKERYPWMKIVTSKMNQATFSSERILSKILESDRKMTLALMERGLISEAPSLSSRTSFPVDLAVEEGSVLDLGRGIKIKFIETPGHSPDLLSGFLEKEGILFCSDGAGFYTPPDFFRPNYWYRLEEAEKSIDQMKTMDPQILCRGHYGAIMGKEGARYHLQRSRQSIEEFKAFVLEWINRGDSIEEITKEVTERYSKGFLQLFPPEDNYRLWGLLVQRTLEHFGIEIEMKD
jgi:glyoxylase-like metal-dependent hydrolase (beta-lactamase superfamily II)